MAKLSIVNMFDQRRWLSHIIFISISVATVFIFYFKSGVIDSLPDKMRFFLLLFVQIEVFIFIASRIFRELSVGLTGKEFTRIILIRFFIFILICFIAALIIFLAFRYLVTLSEHQDPAVYGEILWSMKLRNWFRSTLERFISWSNYFCYHPVAGCVEKRAKTKRRKSYLPE